MAPNAQNTSKRSLVNRYARSSTTHVGGMHLVTYGDKEHRGNCMCLSSCCYDAELGCICRHCAGVGHENCVELNAKRARSRKWREDARRRALSKNA